MKSTLSRQIWWMIIIFVLISIGGSSPAQVIPPPAEFRSDRVLLKPKPDAVAAAFTASPDTGRAPLIVRFADISTGSIVSRVWSFGDGTATSGEQNPTHTYLVPGHYVPILTVTGKNGASSSQSQNIHVAGAVPLKSTTTSTSTNGIASFRDPAVAGQPGAGLIPLEAGSLQLQVKGQPNDLYLIQASTNLLQWINIFTNEAAADGSVGFADAQAGAFPQRFYRGVRLNASAAGIRSDRILVRPKLGLDLSLLNQTLGVRVLNVFPTIGNLQICQLPVGVLADVVIAAYVNSGLVDYAEHDFIVKTLAEPNDFRYGDGSLWHLKNVGQGGGVADADIDAPEAWDTITSASNVIVAVIDTGIRMTHEDLAPNLWTNPGEMAGNGVDDDGNGYVDDVHGINTLQNSGDPTDDFGHGSHVSGILGGAGNNSVGIVGVAWQARIMSCKFLDSQGNGSISDAIKCVDYARSKGAKVINASWGSITFTSQALKDAIASARDADIIFVAAAGNSQGDNDVNPLYPASYDLDNIIAVAATTRTDDLAGFSNYGATTVDLAAPGSPIFSCWNSSDSAYQYFDGTSMAAANVAGACALVRARYPGETHQQIISRILNGVDPLPGLTGKCVSGGRLNLQKALGGSTPPPTPTVTVTASDANASESGDTGTFTVNRTGSTTAALTVNYTMSGTAANGTDYQTLNGTVTVAAGSATAVVTVTPIDDSAVEGNETVILTLSTNAAYIVGSPSTATVTIADNDQPPPPTPTVTVTASDANASESGDTGTFTVSRTGSTTAALTVNYTLGGTASNGTDYQTLSGNVTIAAGTSSAVVTVTPIDDTVVEGNETVILTLSTNAAYIVGSASTATVTIADNDQPPPPTPTVTVTASDANASESGDTGTFTVSRTGSTSATLTVNYTISGTAQNGSDYQTLNGTVTLAAGSATALITLTPIDDTTVEGNETVILTLATNAAYIVDSPANATVTIADNDQTPPPTPTVTVTASDANASESGDTGTFTVSRTGSTTAALTVNYTLSGTASNGADYQSLSGNITIAAGSTSAVVTVTPIDDTVVEGNETVILTLATNAAYIVGSASTATVTIADNDQTPPPTPTVTVTTSDANASESGDTGTFIVSRTGSTAAALTVNYTLSGTAGNGTDYQTLSGNVTIAAGASSSVVTVAPIDDSAEEGNETVILTLSTNAAYIIGSPANATVTIADNDQPPPPTPTISVTASDALASEAGSDPGEFTITRSGSTDIPLIVRFALTGTAGNGTDYQEIPNSVVIPEGASSVTVTIRPVDDDIIEVAELVILTISSDPAYHVGLLNTATVIIVDNDLLLLEP